MDRRLDYLQTKTRRHFLQQSTAGIGGIALASLMADDGLAIESAPSRATDPLASRAPHFAAKAKRVIYLHMSGGPSQFELCDYKPDLQKLDGKDCPQSLLEGKRFAFIEGTLRLSSIITY